ncbi:hypothetical protein KZX46_10870 [Polymorphobacter sp. PAMC 29334]|uniref:hypothetical protein n=1 Tax=Polymorphobacter sp. PAMC 29334 TaxID=2862331 RepID=UPI001C7718F9|nr:hypothetical protein [Polymorphobacter sp. PAMC 29334]QYE36375.1 hypothetical protein KZX46_10870 [Polymorphobacter sp. PAMC 29334]
MSDHIGISGPARSQVERRVRAALRGGVPTFDDCMVERTTDILMIDLRCAGGGDALLQTALDAEDRTIAALAYVATAEQAERGGESRLPNGTKFQLALGGMFFIGGERWVPDEIRGGLQPWETASRAVGGANFFRLLELIDERVRGEPWSVLGRPKPTTFERYGINHGLRFAPFALAGGMWLQLALDHERFAIFSAATEADLHRVAETTAEAMRGMWNDRGHMAHWAKGLRRHAAAVSARCGMEFVGIGIDRARFPDADGDYDFVLEFIGMGDDLRWGRVFQTMWNTELSEDDDPSFPATQDTRLSALRGTLEALGAHGRIDDVAASLIKAASEGEAELLRRLSVDREVCFALPGERSPVWGKLIWRNGTICGEFHQADRIVYSSLCFRPGTIDPNCGSLSMPILDYPETVAAGFLEKPVQGILRTSFPFPGTVRRVERRIDRLELAITVGSRLINLETGAIWHDDVRCSADPAATPPTSPVHGEGR